MVCFSYLKLSILDYDNVEGVCSSCVSSPDVLMSMSAIQPAVSALKHLLSDTSSDVCTSDVLALSVLKYVSRLPYVSVKALEPLLTLSSSKVEYNQFMMHLTMFMSTLFL